jgi:hypothetical protein
MGFARVLLKQNLTVLFTLLLLGMITMTACKESLVKYEDFLEKPSAVRKGDMIEINLGFTAASANWIKPFYKIDDNILYISGELTFKEIPQTISVKLPSPNIKYRVLWVSGDNKKTEIIVNGQP